MSKININGILEAFEHDFFENALTAMVNDMSLWFGVQRIPVFVQNTGDEAFIMDQHTRKRFETLKSGENRDKEALYNVRPRISLDIEGFDFLQDEITSPHAKASFNLNMKDGTRSYRAKMQRIPVSMNIGLQLFTDNLLHALKNSEKLMMILCKHNAFEFTYLGKVYNGSYQFKWALENNRNVSMQYDKERRTATLVTNITLQLQYPNFSIYRKYPAFGMPPPWGDDSTGGNDGSFGNGLDPDPDKNTGENGGVIPDPDIEDITDPENGATWIHYIKDKNGTFETKTVYDGVTEKPIPKHDTIKPPPREGD